MSTFIVPTFQNGLPLEYEGHPREAAEWMLRQAGFEVRSKDHDEKEKDDSDDKFKILLLKKGSVEAEVKLDKKGLPRLVYLDEDGEKIRVGPQLRENEEKEKEVERWIKSVL